MEDEMTLRSGVRYIAMLLIASAAAALIVVNSGLGSDLEIYLVVQSALALVAIGAHAMQTWFGGRESAKRMDSYKDVIINTCPDYWTEGKGCNAEVTCRPYFTDANMDRYRLSAGIQELNLGDLRSESQDKICEMDRDYSWTDLRVRCEAAKSLGAW